MKNKHFSYLHFQKFLLPLRSFVPYPTLKGMEGIFNGTRVRETTLS